MTSSADELVALRRKAEALVEALKNDAPVDEATVMTLDADFRAKYDQYVVASVSLVVVVVV